MLRPCRDGALAITPAKAFVGPLLSALTHPPFPFSATGRVKLGHNSVYVKWKVTIYSAKPSKSPDVDECLSNPCQNGGVCAESSTDGAVATGAYVCTNVAGFSGDHGETDTNECASSPCLNSGT